MAPAGDPRARAVGCRGAARSIGDGEMAYFSTWCPVSTTIETPVAVEGNRWAEQLKVPRAIARGIAAGGAEAGFEVTKTELGLIP